MTLLVTLLFLTLCKADPGLPLTVLATNSSLIVSPTNGGAPRVIVTLGESFSLTAFDQRSGEQVLSTLTQPWGSFGVSQWAGLDPRIYDGYSFRVEAQLQRSYATVAASWQMGTDNASLVLHVNLNDTAVTGRWLELTLKDFEATHFAVGLTYKDANGQVVTEPGKQQCYAQMVQYGAEFYRKLLQNVTAAGFCHTAGLCPLPPTNASAQCQDCMAIASVVAAEIHRYFPNPEENWEDTFMSICDQVGALRIGFGFRLTATEGTLGFGERFNAVNQRGNSLYCWAEDGGWSLGLLPDQRIPKLTFPTETYAPVPFLLSTRGYGLWLNTTWRSTWDLAYSHTDAAVVEAETTSADFVFFLGNGDPLAALQGFTARSGRSLIPPPYQFGTWLRATAELNVSDPVEAHRQLLALDLPASVYDDGLYFLPVGDERGNETRIFSTNVVLKSLGITSLAYYTSMIATNYQPLFSEAEKAGYFVRFRNETFTFAYKGTQTAFDVALLDFTARGSTEWYVQQLNRSVQLGYSGFMYDFGEYVDPECAFSNAMTGREMHNLYPVLYQTVARDFFAKLDVNASDPYAPPYVFYVRSAYAGSGAVTWAAWTGSAMSDWSNASGLPAQIHAMLSASMSGMPYIGSDIGGTAWTTPPNLELWCRWAALGLVSPIMRLQAGGTPLTGLPKTHMLATPQGIAVWRKFAKLRTQLFPYLYSLAHHAHFSGKPLLRHHALVFPFDTVAIKLDLQFTLGDSFLVAPVVTQGATSQQVYLPSGCAWVDFGSTLQFDTSDGRIRIAYGEPVLGGRWVNVPAPLDALPLFVRAGSVIPALDPSVWTLGSSTDPMVVSRENRSEVVHAWMWPNSTGTAEGGAWDGLWLTLSAPSANVNVLNISDPNSRTVIVQIAYGPGVGSVHSVVTVDGRPFTNSGSWTALVDPSTTAVPNCAWAVDPPLGILWLRSSAVCSGLLVRELVLQLA